MTPQTLTLGPPGATPDGAAGSAVLDATHVGDIRGTWGTIRQHDLAPRRTFWHRFRTLAAICGPGWW